MINYLKNIYSDSFENFKKKIYSNLEKNKKTFIVTANPEMLMLAKKTAELNTILLDKSNLIVPDGIGIIKAANKINIHLNERIPGVEVALELIKYAAELNKSIYLFGATEKVINMLVTSIQNQYPSINIVGYSHGYVDDKNKIFEEIVNLKPDIVMVALGVPNQELLINKYYDKFDKGIFIGVGGSFDVISGYKKRAPKIFIKLNLEWLYRILSEPKRINRFYKYNYKFLKEINKNSK